MEVLYLTLAGLFGGLLAGLLGVGGGVIFVFALSFYFEKLGVEGTELTRYLISNSAFATLFAGVSATLRNWRSPHLYKKSALLIGIFGSISSVVVSYFIAAYNWFTPQVFTAFFLILLVVLALRMFSKAKLAVSDHTETRVRLPIFGSIGFLTGIISALSGLGGGIIVVPWLNQGLKWPLIRAASTSLAVIPMLSLSISLFYLVSFSPMKSIDHSIGYISFSASVPLALGVVVMAPIGSNLAKKLPDKTLKISFGILLMVVALKLGISTYL